MNAARNESGKGWKHYGVSMNKDQENDNFHQLFHLLRRKDEGSVPVFHETMEKALSKRKGCVKRQTKLSFFLHSLSSLLPPLRSFPTLAFVSAFFLISAAMTLYFQTKEPHRTVVNITFSNWHSPTLSLLRTTEYGMSQMDSFAYRTSSLDDWQSPTASLLTGELWEPANETIITNNNS